MNQEPDEITQTIMLKFLQNNFPVQKIKNGRRFKRGIVLHGDYLNMDTVHMFMSPQRELEALYVVLAKILTNVFGVTNYEINVVLFKYLGLN